MSELVEYHLPRRGDDIEIWLKSWRKGCFPQGAAEQTIDTLLADYRRHADTGTPLHVSVRERNTE